MHYPYRDRNRRGAAYQPLWPATALLLVLDTAPQAHAHTGPPFVIIMDKRTGPYVVSVWADPNVGTGKFYIMLDPPPGAALQQDTSVEIGVQPVSGRLPEARYPAERQQLQRVEYYVEVPFDAQERWRVHVMLHGSGGSAETSTEVDVTPPGLGPIDCFVYTLPFLFVGGLWFRGMTRARKQRAAQQPGQTDQGVNQR